MPISSVITCRITTSKDCKLGLQQDKQGSRLLSSGMYADLYRGTYTSRDDCGAWGPQGFTIELIQTTLQLRCSNCSAIFNCHAQHLFSIS